MNEEQERLEKLARQGVELGKRFVEMQLSEISREIDELLKNPGDSLYESSKEALGGNIGLAKVAINQHLTEHKIDATEYIERLNKIKERYELLD